MAPQRDEYLRGASRLVAASGGRRRPLHQLSGVRGNAPSLCARNGLYPHRAVADRGASLRRFVGLSGDQLLRADESLRGVVIGHLITPRTFEGMLRDRQ